MNLKSCEICINVFVLLLALYKYVLPLFNLLALIVICFISKDQSLCSCSICLLDRVTYACIKVEKTQTLMHLYANVPSKVYVFKTHYKKR